MNVTKRGAWAVALALAASFAVPAPVPAAADEPGAPGNPANAEREKWGEHWGDLPFIVGYEKGMAEVEFTGRPPMYFFTTTW